MHPYAAATGQSVAHDQVISEWHQSGRLVSPIRMLRTATWKYNLHLGYGEELYDLKNDPHELTNLAGRSRLQGRDLVSLVQLA